MRRAILALGLAGLVLAACDNANEQTSADPPAGETQTESGATERAQNALQEAGESALDAAAKLGEAGKAGLEALQENAPEIREGLSEAADQARQAAGEAGERLQGAADALLRDDSDAPPLDAEGDSEADLNEVPETQERPAAPAQ